MQNKRKKKYKKKIYNNSRKHSCKLKINFQIKTNSKNNFSYQNSIFVLCVRAENDFIDKKEKIFQKTCNSGEK